MIDTRILDAWTRYVNALHCVQQLSGEMYEKLGYDEIEQAQFYIAQAQGALEKVNIAKLVRDATMDS